MIDEIRTIDWDKVRLKQAVTGLTAMLLAVAVFGTLDDAVLSGVMATLFVIAAGGDGPMRDRLPAMVRMTLYGAVIGGLAFWSADSALAVAVVLGIATYLGTLGAAFGRRAGRVGLLLTLWAIMALIIGSEATDPWQVSVAFVVGGAIAIGVTAIRLRFFGEQDAEADDPPDDLDRVDLASSHWDRIGAAVSSRIGRFAVLRTLGVVVGVLLGFWWFSSYPMWVAITVIVVVQPSVRQSASIGIQRTLGTALGVVVAIALAQVLPRGETGVIIAFLLSGVLMVAFMGANYTLFAAFLTAFLVFGQRLAQADAFEAGWERLLATGVGAMIAFGVIGAAAVVNGNNAERQE